MAVRIRCLSRRVGHAAAARIASRRIHASVLLAPSIAVKGQKFALPLDATGLPTGSNAAATLLEEAEARLRKHIEEAEKTLREQSQLELAAATARAMKIALPGLRQQLLSDDAETQLSGAEQIRKILSDSGESPIGDVVAAGLIPPLVELLAPSVATPLQLEAAWALTNIASGSSEHVEELVASGAVPSLIHLLTSPDDSVREQAAWALGNISGDSADLRDLVISGGALSALCEMLREPGEDKSALAHTASWVLANFCRGSPVPSREHLEPAFPVLERLLNSDNEEVAEQACWAFAYLTKASEEYVKMIVTLGLHQKLADMLVHREDKIQIPVLRVLGNIAAATDEDTRAVVDSGVLATLVQLVAHPSKKLRVGSCWILSNIFVGCPDQIQHAIDSNVTEHMLPLLQSGPLEVRKEAIWAIGNMIMHGKSHHVTHLVECGCVAAVVESLHVFDDETNVRLLAVTERILTVGQELQTRSHVHYNPFAMLVQQANIIGKIEAFKSHSSEEARDLATRLLALL